MADSNNNSRKTKVVNPGYQYRAAFTTVLIAIIVINGVIVASALLPEAIAQLFQQVHFIYYLIGVVEVVLIYLFWRYTINSTHRVAGPVYAIDRELRKLRDGDLTFNITFRPRDQFQDSAVSINGSIEHLREEIRQIKRMASELESEPTREKAERLNEALARLNTDNTGDSQPGEHGSQRS